MLQCKQHLFYVFCVIANLWQSESASFFFCTNDVICHALWLFLSVLNNWGWWGVTALLLNLKFRGRIWLKPLPKLGPLSISPNWPARPWPDQSFWQWISLFPRVFRAEKPLCMLFRIWLIWLDSYDKMESTLSWICKQQTTLTMGLPAR